MGPVLILFQDIGLHSWQLTLVNGLVNGRKTNGDCQCTVQKGANFFVPLLFRTHLRSPKHKMKGSEAKVGYFTAFKIKFCLHHVDNNFFNNFAPSGLISVSPFSHPL